MDYTGWIQDPAATGIAAYLMNSAELYMDLREPVGLSLVESEL